MENLGAVLKTLRNMKEIEQIQKIIDGMKLKNIPLMKKSEADKKVEECHVYTHAYKVDDMHPDFFWGRDMHTYEPSYGDPTYWSYEQKSVEKKIKDDGVYKVWYTYSDSADPYDSTTSYHVYYVEEVPAEKRELINFLKRTIANLE